jgi:NCAIR mutase (PurE)-related protein
MIETFRMDWQREERTGFPEAVLCSDKSSEEVEAIVETAVRQNARLFLTRLSVQTYESIQPPLRQKLDYCQRSGAARLGAVCENFTSGIGIVTAGTSDLPVGLEAKATLEFMGFEGPIIADVGVAGLWRLMARLEEIRKFRVIIAVAGMEGALFSVLGGLVKAPVIAVPSPVGYGISGGGKAALMSALATCSPGVVVVNIGNGFGAAASAIKILAC